MNKVILMGRLTRDPDIRWSQGQDQKCTARFTLAVDRKVKRQEGNDQQQTADFPPCVAFGKTAEWFEKWVHQGMRITLSGRLQTGSYTNREGQKVYTTDVIVEEAEFAESKAAQERNGSGNAQNGRQEPRSNQAGNYSAGYGNGQQGGYTPSDVGEGFMNIPDGVEDEGLPFN